VQPGVPAAAGPAVAPVAKNTKPNRASYHKRIWPEPQAEATSPRRKQNGVPSSTSTPQGKKRGGSWSDIGVYGNKQFVHSPGERSLFDILRAKEPQVTSPAGPTSPSGDPRNGTRNLPGRLSSLPKGFDPYPRSPPKKSPTTLLGSVAEATTGLDGAAPSTPVVARAQLPSVMTGTPSSRGDTHIRLDPTAAPFYSPRLEAAARLQDAKKLSAVANVANRPDSHSRENSFLTAKSHQTEDSSGKDDSPAGSPKEDTPEKTTSSASASPTNVMPARRSRDSSFASEKLPGGQDNETSRESSFQTAKTQSTGISATSSAKGSNTAQPTSRKPSRSSLKPQGSGKSQASAKSHTTPHRMATIRRAATTS